MNLSSQSALRRLASPLLSAALLSPLMGCHTPPRHNDQIEEARQAVQDASANPHVVSSAQIELDQARKTLYEAEHAWAERHDPQETGHLAYMARQQARIAQNVGMQHAAADTLKAASAERTRIQGMAAGQQAAAQARASAQAAEQRADSLEQQLQSLSARPTARGMVVMLQAVLFDVGQARLRAGAAARLQLLAEVLQAHPERHVRIEGHTDSTGGAAMNQDLSARRADAVKAALVNLGVAAERIETEGYGERRPVATNKTAAGRQQNRRVEVVFSDAHGTFNAQQDHQEQR